MNGIFNYQIPGRVTAYNADQYQRPGTHSGHSHSFNPGFNLNNQFQDIFNNISNLLNSLIGNINSHGGNGAGHGGWSDPGYGSKPEISTLAFPEDGGSTGWKPGHTGKPDQGGNAVTLAFPEDGAGLSPKDKAPGVELVDIALDEPNLGYGKGKGGGPGGNAVTLAFPEDGAGLSPKDKAPGVELVDIALDEPNLGYGKGKGGGPGGNAVTLAFPEDGGGTIPPIGKAPDYIVGGDAITLAFPEDGAGLSPKDKADGVELVPLPPSKPKGY